MKRLVIEILKEKKTEDKYPRKTSIIQKTSLK